jgi:hypothetical protein
LVEATFARLPDAFDGFECFGCRIFILSAGGAGGMLISHLAPLSFDIAILAAIVLFIMT